MESPELWAEVDDDGLMVPGWLWAEQRSEVLLVRVSPQEKEGIRARAQKLGVSMSELVRRRVL